MGAVSLMADSKNNRKKQKKEFTIEWDHEADVVRYANQLAVQFTQSEAHLSFFEIKPPLPTMRVTSGDTGENPLPPTIKAKCVARIIVSPSRIGEFLRVISDGLQEVTKPNDDEVNATPKKNVRGEL